MAIYKLLGITDVHLGYSFSFTIGATGQADAITTALTVATGQGSKFASASPGNPITAVIGSEVEYVTARAADSLTVLRAQEGSTGAAHSSGASGSGLAWVDLPFANAFNLDANINNVTFEGDGTQELVPISNGVTGTMTASKFTTDLLDRIAGIVPTTTGLPVDEASRYYPEEGTYPYVDARVTLKGIDDISGANVKLRLEIFKMKIQTPWTPGAAGNNAAMQSELAWTSVKTTVDLLGRALPGLIANSEGIHFSIAPLV